MTKFIFFRRLSATAQFILGFLLGITLIAGASATAIFLYYKQMSVFPKKPIFSQSEQEFASTTTEPPVVTSEPLETTLTQNEVEQFEDLTEPEVEPEVEQFEDLAEPEVEPEVEPELPPNAYRAVVTWPQGLSLRAEPSTNSGKVDGIGFDETIIILEDSADGQWQRVRVPSSNKEGWVKAGNVKRTSD